MNIKKIKYLWMIFAIPIIYIFLNLQCVSAGNTKSVPHTYSGSDYVNKPAITIVGYNDGFQYGAGNYVGPSAYVQVKVTPRSGKNGLTINDFTYGAKTWYKSSAGHYKTYNSSVASIGFNLNYYKTVTSTRPGDTTVSHARVSGRITYPIDITKPSASVNGPALSCSFHETTTGFNYTCTSTKWYSLYDTPSYSMGCSDNQSGCKGTDTLTIKAGSNRGTMVVEDWAGNGRAAQITIKRDGTGPNGWYPYITPTGWTRTASLCGRCTSDTGAGCGYDKCVTVTSNGNKQVCAQDAIGNLSCGTYNVTNIDRTPPSCGTITKPDGNYWYRTSFNVSSRCSDSQSGCARNPFTESENTPSGTVAIWDVLGNTDYCPFSGVAVDTTGPTTTIKFNEAHKDDSEKYQASEEVEVIISATDSQSGVNRVCYRMSGATNIGDTCVNGSSTKVYVSAEGKTAITAWSYDNARDYVSATNSGAYTTGNKSANVSLNAYVDYTVPTINISSNNDGKTWSNKATPVTVNITDAGSGIGYYRYYWSTTDSDIYDESTALYRSGSGNVVNTTLSTNASGNWYNSRTITETNPTNLAHNDVIYLHVQACDRSFYKNNCSTKTYKVGIHFDNVKPETPTLSSMSQEWVNKYQLTINASEFIQTNKQNSGLNTIYTYWDTNVNHQEASFTRENSSYSSTANLTNANPSNTYTAKYNWTIDFANLKNMLKNGAESSVGAATEGSRFIRIRVTDIAGNWSDYLTAGPFKWDTTSPIAEITDITGDERTFLPAENNQ